jgi:hypothetical protein
MLVPTMRGRYHRSFPDCNYRSSLGMFALFASKAVLMMYRRSSTFPPQKRLADHVQRPGQLGVCLPQRLKVSSVIHFDS